MKSFFLAAILCLAAMTLSFANPPAVNALQAAQIAQADLEERGLQDQVYIEQIIFKEASLVNSESYWEILWNDEFKAQTEGRKEYGIRVFMDGNYKRAVR